MKFRQLDLFGEEPTSPPSVAKPNSKPAPPPAPVEQPLATQPIIAPEPVQPTQKDPIIHAGIGTPPQAARRGRRSVRQARTASTVSLPPDEQLYTRQYYGIGEVAAMFQEKVSVLRYWESEFDVLDLRKNRKGDRFFRPDDIKTVRLIHHLLRERRFTIEGAREYIRNNSRARDRIEAIEMLRRIRGFLIEVMETLRNRSESK